MAAFVGIAALLAWATPPCRPRALLLAGRPGRRHRRLDAVEAAALAGRRRELGAVQLDHTGALPAYTVLTVLVVWQAFPFIAVSVLAGLKTVPGRAARGRPGGRRGPWRVFWRITYPLLKPIFLVLLLLSVIWDFGIFTQALHHHRRPRQPGRVQPVALRLRQGVREPAAEYGLGGALALILTLILLVITVGYVRASVRQGALT